MRKKQILVVEDNELNREILCGILSEEYLVLEAENGLAALDILRKKADEISLILLDIMMPVMDGYTFLDTIRADKSLSLTPVIVTTQSDTDSDEISALDHGATDFVSKPYNPQVILHRVASLIKLRENAALANQLKFDRLTGLYNLEFFCTKAKELLDEFPEREYNIVCTNIDNFKVYNDTFGWDAGNSLLVALSRAIIENIGDSGICARIGADRFILMRERAGEQLSRHGMISGEFLNMYPILKNVILRLGVYEIVDRSISVEQMCSRAQLAADSIIGQYGHRFSIYNDSLRAKLLREHEITDAMNDALKEEQFVVYYQPKYSLVESCMSGAEALVRWQHPEWGFLPPGEFIPLFEKNGFIHKLDEYVWERVCKQLQAWKAAGIPVVPVSVNVSRADIFHNDLTDIFLDLTRKYSISPSLIHIEITESAYAHNPSQIITTVDELRSLGFAVEMDDFGSGYSSLNMLSRMNLDVLKLDAGFIRYEASKSGEHSIVSDVIRLAHRLNLSVVAEGVETRDQVNRLRLMGCDCIQGYFFARPMPASEFEELLRTCHTSENVCIPESLPEKRGLPTILVVDENAAYINTIRDSLGEFYTIVGENSADSALSFILTHGSGIGAMLLSATLPGDDSVRLLSSIRKISGLWDLPVISTIPDGSCTELLPFTSMTDDFICRCHPLTDLQRRIRNLLDAASPRRRDSSLNNIAYKDFLSGLLTRRGLQLAMSTVRSDDLPLSLLMFDIDPDKKIEEAYGQPTIERMVRIFSDLLSCHTRHGDILCRYDVTKFVVIFLKSGNEDDAVKKARYICTAFREFFGEESWHADCRAGAVICNPGDCVANHTIDRAKHALEQAAKSGRDVYLYSPG